MCVCVCAIFSASICSWTKLYRCASKHFRLICLADAGHCCCWSLFFGHCFRLVFHLHNHNNHNILWSISEADIKIYSRFYISFGFLSCCLLLFLFVFVMVISFCLRIHCSFSMWSNHVRNFRLNWIRSDHFCGHRQKVERSESIT